MSDVCSPFAGTKGRVTLIRPIGHETLGVWKAAKWRNAENEMSLPLSSSYYVSYITCISKNYSYLHLLPWFWQSSERGVATLSQSVRDSRDSSLKIHGDLWDGGKGSDSRDSALYFDSLASRDRPRSSTIGANGGSSTKIPRPVGASF